MKATKSALLVGVGGQGAILTAKVLVNGLMKAGYDVKMSEVHGMSQRGGSVSTQVHWGEKVYSPVIGKGAADIIVDPQDLAAMEQAVQDALASDVPAAIITRRPCLLIKRIKHNTALCEVDADKCIGCKKCLKVGCPAVMMENKKSRIDPTQCVGCTVCAQVCPKDAITRKER